MTDPSGKTGVIDEGKNVGRGQINQRQKSLNSFQLKIFLIGPQTRCVLMACQANIDKLNIRRGDTQHSDIHQNDSQHNDTPYCYGECRLC